MERCESCDLLITSLYSIKTLKKKTHFANDAPFESSSSHRAAGRPGSLQSHLTQLTPLMTHGQMTHKQSYALALRPTKPDDHVPTERNCRGTSLKETLGGKLESFNKYKRLE